MNYLVNIVLGCLFLLTDLPAFTQVSGNVFRDYNTNGQRDSSSGFSEPWVAGILVKATLKSGSVFSTITSTDGSFTFTNAQISTGSKVRIEISFPTTTYTAFAGLNHESNVQFASAPCTNLRFGISSPEDYWNNIQDPDPALLVVQEPRGTYNGYMAGRASVLHLKNSTHGPSPATSAYNLTIDTSKRPARFGNTGAIFGLAYQKKQDRFFLSAILKRTFGFGPKGPGGIYYCTKSGDSWAFSGGFSLQNVRPKNNGTLLDFGSVIRNTTTPSDDNYISGLQMATSKSRDLDAFAKVATMSVGGMDIDFETDSIYLINLYQSRLIVVDGTHPSASYNNADTSWLHNQVSAYNLNSLPGYPAATGTGNQLRPFGIRIYKGRGYIGVISDASATQSAADLKGYILSFDPLHLSSGFTTEITIQFNLYRGDPLRVFKPWVSNWIQAGGTATSNPKFCAQPIISDIEFNEDGSMDIGIRDRWGDQNAMDYDAVPGATNAGLSIEQGDLLHACKVGNQWIIEGMANSCLQPVQEGNPRLPPYNATGYGNSYNNTGREYYADVSGDNENESAEGTLAKLIGSHTIVTSTYDPIDDSKEPNGNYWYTQGLHWNDVVTGKKKQMARTAIIGTLQVSKTNGIGDIEFVTGYQPIQIGNRVWNDANGNGLQDADESGIQGVQISLRSPGIDGIYFTADDQISNTTTNLMGLYYFDASTISFADARKPVGWTNVRGILPGYPYQIEIDSGQSALRGYHFTGNSNTDSSRRTIDNDGSPDGAMVISRFSTTHNTHDIDFGFKNMTTIAGYVWNDRNSNGIQQTDENGIGNVTATLYDSSGTAVGSGITNNTGHYLIENVPPGNGLYIIFSNLPLGGTFTVSLVGGVDATNNSKADSYGIIDSIVVSPGDHLSGFDAGIKGLNTVLPLQLINFTASATTHRVQLKWETLQESDILSYQVERASDETAFIPIHRVQARNNPAHLQQYQHTDSPPFEGIWYYRIEVLNREGLTLKTQTRKVVLKAPKLELSLYPNPAQNKLWITMNPALRQQQVSIEFSTITGQLLQIIKPQSDAQPMSIPLEQFPNGHYIIKCSIGNQPSVYRHIQIQH